MPESTHIDSIRQSLPSVTSQIFFNTGSFGPIPAVVAETIQQRIHYEYTHGRLGKEAFDEIAEISSQARSQVAQLLNADVDEIALTDNTGEGMNIPCYGLTWQAGDEVITTNHEHISGLAPLYQLRDRKGIVIRVADLGAQADRPLVATIKELITPRTRLISLSHVTWSTGTVLDIQSVAQLAHAYNIPVLVDGAHRPVTSRSMSKSWISTSTLSQCKNGSVGQMEPGRCI